MRQWKAGNRVFTQDQVDALHAMCGLPKTRCIVSLKHSGGHVADTLNALIDIGIVRSSDLDPDTVPDGFFIRAAKRERRAASDTVEKQVKRLAKKLPKDIDRKVAQALDELAAAKFQDQLSNSFTVSYRRNRQRQAALENDPVVVHLPPLPPLTLALGDWVGEDVLKSWAGFGEKRRSHGRVVINIPRARGKADTDDAPVPPAKEMVAAYAHLKAHEVEVRDAVLAAFRSHINDTLIGEYGWRTDPIKDVKALRRMLEISSVHPMAVAKKGMSYLGLFFHCTWDPEHNAGVLLHGSRVITVGDNEACGDEFAAMDDGGKRLRLWKW